MIQDNAIAWNRKRKFIPCSDMTGFGADQITSLGNGTPLFQEALAASELGGLAIASAGDEIYHFWPLPWDFDRFQPIRFRLWFTHSTTDTDNPDWRIDYKALAKQAAISDARDSGDEIITFAAAAVSAVADGLEILSWQESSSDLYITSAGVALQIAIECNGLGGAGGNEITLMGLEMEYTVRATGNSATRDITRNAPNNV